jgi:TRAP-type C4-dicarboxylate transport system permease large subunit
MPQIIIGAVIVANWHAVILAFVVTAVLAVLGVAVVLLLHSHRRHYDPELEQRAELERRPNAASAALPPPVVHNHMHLHGVTPADVAAITARQPDLYGTISGQPAAIEENYQ